MDGTTLASSYEERTVYIKSEERERIRYFKLHFVCAADQLLWFFICNAHVRDIANIIIYIPYFCISTPFEQWTLYGNNQVLCYNKDRPLHVIVRMLDNPCILLHVSISNIYHLLIIFFKLQYKFIYNYILFSIVHYWTMFIINYFSIITFFFQTTGVFQINIWKINKRNKGKLFHFNVNR